MTVILNSDVVEWMRSGERGTSSEAIVSRLTGCPMGRKDFPYPRDPDDLRRCVLLLEACPTLAERFGEMASASPTWSRMVASWSTLVATFDAEKPGWRKGWKGPATKTYNAMFALRDEDMR